MKKESRILIVQTGDYKEAFLRLTTDGPETYRDQRRSVDYVASLAPMSTVTSVSIGDDLHHLELAPGLWSQQIGRIDMNPANVRRIFDAQKPTHVILRTPLVPFIAEARRRNVATLPCFADLFMRGGPRTFIRNQRLRHIMLGLHAPCFSNHSLNASRSMVDVLGLPADKVVPWDWSRLPVGPTARKAPADPTRLRAFFAGALIEAKGVRDCLEAVADLSKQSIRLEMSFAGSGDVAFWAELAAKLGVGDQVNWLGVIPHDAVRTAMAEHDFVIVPSRHDYDEGLPNTIYEGLASRSVLIISDHPAFAGRLKPDKQVLVFKAGDCHSLASCVARAVRQPELYASLSRNSAKAHDDLYVGLEWTKLVNAFLDDPENATGWVQKASLE